ncbi:MAG: RepB family plasmid replication initiator protein [Candidatus Riflebacteria bacterium]|nr:RepB family plasmid replication initiator protein [Candidatus Riflebacteria bacterium]
MERYDLFIDREARDIDLHWVEAAEYGDKGYVKICINQVLKPYLLNLKAHFTKYYSSFKKYVFNQNL